MVNVGTSPFTQKVLAYPLPPRFRPPTIDLFDGSGNPGDHVELFCLHMHVQSYADPVLCCAFSFTLKGPTQSWFSSLPLGSINDFDTLNALFVSHFVSNRLLKRPSSYLFSIKQGSKESL